jgi:hypothetical protein
MLKFSLTANDFQREGFKLSVSTDGEKEMEIAKELTNKLISKISVIEIKQNQGGNEDEY